MGCAAATFKRPQKLKCKCSHLISNGLNWLSETAPLTPRVKIQMVHLSPFCSNVPSAALLLAYIPIGIRRLCVCAALYFPF